MLPTLLDIVRDVPALRCDSDHEYILEETLNEIDDLLDPEKSCQVEPAETIQVPCSA